MNGFDEVLLPLGVALGATGGPELATEVVRLASGVESRNARWSRSRRRWEVGGAVMRTDQAQELMAFFEARSGRMRGFRFRDPLDWKSCISSQDVSASDQPLGVGDGVSVSFQLRKQSDAGPERVIAKPVAGSVVVAIDGVVTEAFDVDVVTGVVTFDAAPVDGAVLTAGFAFDVPVRFDADRLDVALVGHDAVRVVRAPLAEVTG